MTQQLSELQMNATLAMRAEQSLEAVRELAALLAQDSTEAAHLRERLSVQGSLRPYDIYLTLSVLAQAVVQRERRIAELEERIDALTAR
jgi:hypothetical protein